MSAEDSTPADDPLKPRHRPNLSQLSDTTTEEDLWDLDDSLIDSATASGKEPALRSMPVRPTTDQADQAGDSESLASSVRLNMARPPMKARPSKIAVDVSKSQSAFDDLESWDEAAPVERLIEIRPLPEQSVAEPFKPTSDAEMVDRMIGAEEAARGKTEPSPVVTKHGFSAIEKLGMVMLAIVLATAGVLAWWFSIHGLPDQVVGREIPDFPVEGRYLTIDSVETYWREPKLEGDAQDPVVRGTKLIPEVVLHTSEGSGTVQVRFFDDRGTLRGDTITRAVKGDLHVTVAATEGFDDLGRYAEYRTVDRGYWRVEVLEGVVGATKGEEFSRLFTMDVSADRR
jgi:hypothetical protein